MAKKFNTTVELLQKSNRLKSDLIYAGQKLKVHTAKFSVVVDRSGNTLFLKSGEEAVKVYRVATGKDNRTPLGTFTIINKLVNPVWFKVGAIVPSGSPENLLGTRWMGLSKRGYGVHGTVNEQSIGNHVTEGCVRMANHDVEELFSIVPVGTEITIID
ncbi:MAG: L,D-transpeptidase family protein [Candidatus Omnitrophica bacterium]|nr:L,D-transpeptidase family protein [Candidatus Omnitrophota bacterium]